MSFTMKPSHAAPSCLSSYESHCGNADWDAAGLGYSLKRKRSELNDETVTVGRCLLDRPRAVSDDERGRSRMRRVRAQLALAGALS